LLTDNLSTLVTGIKYGRLCFENLRKSILYLLPAGMCSKRCTSAVLDMLQTGSFSELIPVLLNVLTGVPQALSSIQMIIVRDDSAYTDLNLGAQSHPKFRSV
jgi:sodium/potassium-transporting ATPase subunit alpha